MAAKRVFVLVLFLGSVFSIFGEAGFSGLDLSGNNRLLFKGTTDAPGYTSYDTLFLAGLGGKNGTVSGVRQLSFFPEKIMLLGSASRLQIQNRFGIFRTDDRLEKFAPVAGFPSFVSGREIVSGQLPEISTSPDGRYLAFLSSSSYAYGDLYLSDMENGKTVLISRKLELSGGEPPVLWSPDSSYFVYARDRSLYYFATAQLKEGRVLDEAYRSLGAGTIRCVLWGRDGSIFQISGELVWRIRTPELFTGSLYAGFMKAGTIAGKIPFVFDPNFDSFRISPDGRKILLSKGGQNLFIYSLSQSDSGAANAVNLPYLLLPRNTVVRDVLWSSDDIVTVLVGSRLHGTETQSVYRLTPGSASPSFVLQKDEGVKRIALSPDGSKAAVVTGNGVQLKDYRTWQNGRLLPFRSPLHVLWTPDGKLIVAGSETVERLDPETGGSMFIALSQAGEYGFSPDSEAVRIRLPDRNIEFNPADGRCTQAAVPDIRKPATASEDFRVYLERQTSGSYRNIVMVRDIRSMGTHPLTVLPERSYELFPVKEEPSDASNFTHGSRIRRREVSLVFDAIDSSEGLMDVLSTLSNYGVKATFFVNGEFIRRYPEAVKEIAESGHEVGSLFSSYFDMTDERFKVDDEFVRKGLARNEDDYFGVTGKELSLIWHAPYYFVNSQLISAAGRLNYVYTGRDIDTLDWVSSEDRGVTGDLYYTSAALVERILKLKRPGSILPIRIGKTAKDREDYLFQKLDLLINNLVVAGYSVVPVSTLMDHAR